jgi:hypothetical protein
MLAALTAARIAAADTGVGIDLQQGNKLDPTGGIAYYDCDPSGRSARTNIEHETPTGFLYPCPEIPPVDTPTGQWSYHGVLDLGELHLSGENTGDTIYQKYNDWRNGFVLGKAILHFERPEDGSYVDFRGSSMSDTNQFFKLTVGRFGAYTLTAFVRDLPNIVSGDAKPIWNGIGTNNITLPPSLKPGSTPAEVSAVSAAALTRRLEVDRQKEGVSMNYYFTNSLTAYGSVTYEGRKGERPFGGPFFFAFAIPGDGGVLETVKPIDDHTINANFGVRYAGSEWRYEVGYSGSFYRDHYQVFHYQDPFNLFSVIGGSDLTTTYNGQPSTLYQGQWAMEPDNNYDQIRTSVTRTLPLNAEVSATASGAQFYQNEGLIPQIDCTGQFGTITNPANPTGAGAANGNPFLYNCNQWNSVKDLSRPTADLRMNTGSFDGSYIMRPTSEWTLRSTLKWYEQDYAGTYTNYNPVTGQYGYIGENGAYFAFVPGGGGLYNAPGGEWQIKNIPLTYVTHEGTLGADFRPNRANTFGFTATYNRYDPENRERMYVVDESAKVNWTNRSLSWLTFRANYLYMHQTGGPYNPNPYFFAYTDALPGFVCPAGGCLARTVDAMRKFDVANKNENKVDFMATWNFNPTMTLTTTFRGDYNTYPDSVIGRAGYNLTTGLINWEWQPKPGTNLNVFYSHDESSLHQANVADPGGACTSFGFTCTETDDVLGGSTYPLSARWWLADKEQDNTVGVVFKKNFTHFRLDAAYNFQYSQSIQSFNAVSGLALAYPADAIYGLSGAFPTMFERTNSLNLAVLVPINNRMTVRLFEYYETSKIFDWHYANFDNTLVYGNRVYTDGGPRNYSANVVGLFFTVKL